VSHILASNWGLVVFVGAGCVWVASGAGCMASANIEKVCCNSLSSWQYCEFTLRNSGIMSFSFLTTSCGVS